MKYLRCPKHPNIDSLIPYTRHHRRYYVCSACEDEWHSQGNYGRSGKEIATVIPIRIAKEEKQDLEDNFELLNRVLIGDKKTVIKMLGGEQGSEPMSRAKEYETGYRKTFIVTGQKTGYENGSEQTK